MKIRLPADLKDQIEAAAKDSGRSMNAEIVARLERSFSSENTIRSDDKDELQKMRDAQISLAFAGLNLAEMASKFLELEIPKVATSKSFPNLKEAISVCKNSIAHDISNPDLAYDAAIKGFSDFKAIADDLGITRIVAALKKSDLTELLDSTDTEQNISKN